MFGGRLERGIGLLAGVLTHTRTHARTHAHTHARARENVTQKGRPHTPIFPWRFTTMILISCCSKPYVATLFGLNIYFNLLIFNLVYSFFI